MKIELDVIRGMDVPEGTNEILAVCDGKWHHLHRNHLGRWVVHGGISWVKEFTAWAKVPEHGDIECVCGGDNVVDMSDAHCVC